MLNRLKTHLHDNSGSEYTSKIILIAIAFAAGSLLITILMAALNTSFGDSVKSIIQNIFNW